MYFNHKSKLFCFESKFFTIFTSLIQKNNRHEEQFYCSDMRIARILRRK